MQHNELLYKCATQEKPHSSNIAWLKKNISLYTLLLISAWKVNYNLLPSLGKTIKGLKDFAASKSIKA